MFQRMKQTDLNSVVVDQDAEAQLDRVFERIHALYGNNLPAFFRHLDASADQDAVVPEPKGQLNFAILGCHREEDKI
jgi:hypothetical protein